MELKPMFQTSTMTFAAPAIQTKKLESKVVVDPTGSIPNGIYKVIRWEKLRQLFTILISGLTGIFMGTLIALYATVWEASWVGFIIPILALLISLYKFLMTFGERGYLLRSVIKYREDLKIGLTSTPPFISKLYIQLHKKQIAHNWITFGLMFYGGIFTLLLWWLKDTSWWIFHFDEWVQSLFSNPSLMIYLFTGSLLVVITLHIVLTVQRKRRMLEINAFFGLSLMPESELSVIKDAKNKSYRRIFIISVMIIALVPALIWMILKLVKRRKK